MALWVALRWFLNFPHSPIIKLVPTPSGRMCLFLSELELNLELPYHLPNAPREHSVYFPRHTISPWGREAGAALRSNTSFEDTESGLLICAVRYDFMILPSWLLSVAGLWNHFAWETHANCLGWKKQIMNSPSPLAELLSDSKLTP